MIKMTSSLEHASYSGFKPGMCVRDENYFYQGVSSWDGTQNARYGLRFNYKEETSTNQTKIGFKVLYRLRSDTSHDGCSTGNNKHGLRDINDTASSANYVVHINSGMYWIFNSNWLLKQEPLAYVDQTNGVFRDGYDIQIRLHARSVRPSDGTLRPVHFDNIHLVGEKT